MMDTFNEFNHRSELFGCTMKDYALKKDYMVDNGYIQWEIEFKKLLTSKFV